MFTQNNKELEIFKGKELPKNAEKYNSKKENDTSKANSQTPGQQNLMEDVYEYVTTRYDFFVSDDENLYMYNNDRGYWKLLVESDSNRILRRILPKGFLGRVNKSTLYELREWLLAYSPLVKSEELKKSRNYINFRDVAYNVKDGTTTNDRRELYFKYSLDIDYKSGEKEPSGVFEAFIEEALDYDENTILQFRKFFALCLSNARGLRESAFFLYGPSGTGKSTLLRVLRHVIGNEHVCSISFGQLSNEFAVATLHGRHVVLSSEISDLGNKKLDVFKSLTGDDLISTCQKGKDYFTLESRAVFVFATNILPKIDNKAEAESVLSRMVIFPFTHVFDKSESKTEYWMDLIRDTSGIVNFALEGFKDLRADNFQFFESKKMAEFKKDFASDNDSFSLFAKDHLKLETDYCTSSSEIDQAYRIYCSINYIEPMNPKKYIPILKRNFGCLSTNMSLGEGKRCRGYKGIKLAKQALKLIGGEAHDHRETLQEMIFGPDDEDLKVKNPDRQEYSSEDFLEEIKKAYKTDDNEYIDSEEE